MSLRPLSAPLATALAAGLFIVSLSCDSRERPAPPRPLPPNIESALAYLEAQPDLAPSALLLLDPLRRWYGLEIFPDLNERYQAVVRSSGLPYFRVMRRIIYPMKLAGNESLRWEDFAKEMLEGGGINTVTIPALYCDQVPYPEAYESSLQTSVRAGEYDLTHVGLALRWIDENGCEPPMDSSFEPQVARAIAELVNPADGVTDLEMEATAMLMYMGRRDLVSAAMVDAIASAQRPDGGWSLDTNNDALASEWHPTLLAMWVLLGQHAPEIAMSPIVVPDEASLP